MEKRNIPEVRFKGFSEDWEEDLLGNHTKLITKGTTPNGLEGNEVNFIKVENIDNEAMKIISTSKISIEEHDNYLARSKLEKDDILFSIAGSLGITAIITADLLPANTNQALAIIRLKNSLKNNYVYYFLQTKKVKKYINKLKTVGAQPNISLKQLNEVLIDIPEFIEQEKIGKLFESIDEMIEGQEKLVEANKNLKKSLLQKMFPNKGEKVPELRLKGFNGEWEEKVLREVLKERKEEDTPSKTFPLVSFTVENGVTPKTERYEREFLVKETDKKYKVTRLNDLVYNPILAVECRIYL